MCSVDVAFSNSSSESTPIQRDLDKIPAQVDFSKKMFKFLSLVKFHGSRISAISGAAGWEEMGTLPLCFYIPEFKLS